MVKFLGEFRFEDMDTYLFDKFSELENFEDEECSLKVEYDKITIKANENYLIIGPKLEIILEEEFCDLKLFREYPVVEIFPDWEIDWDEYFEDIDIDLILNMIYDRFVELEEEE